MEITVLSSDLNHPVVPHLQQWVSLMSTSGHVCRLIFKKEDLTEGDFLFLVSCAYIITGDEIKRFKHTLVLHASDLPKDRGWSPHIWNIVNGANRITVALLEAEKSVDTGRIWKKIDFDLRGDELLDEINEALFDIELRLMSYAVNNLDKIQPVEQVGTAGAYLKRRTPEHSRIDITKSIQEQFNLFRVVDNERYPAFFDYLGERYILKIEKKKKTHESI